MMPDMNARKIVLGVLSEVWRDLDGIDMAVEPYEEIKVFLDKTARGTMHKFRGMVNKTLRFEGEDNG